MPMYVLNRDRVLSTLFGHRITFKKDQPTWVPPRVVPDAVAVGASPADGSDPILEGAAAARAAGNEPPGAQDPIMRVKLLLDAIRLLVDRNDMNDFGGDNAPKVDAIRQMAGFPIDTRERNEVWQKYHDLKAAGEL